MSDEHRNSPPYLDDLAVGERFGSATADGGTVQILTVKRVVPRHAAR